MAWIKSSSKKNIIVRSSLEAAQSFLLNIVDCGKLMPDVVKLEQVGPDIFHYELAEFSNGAIRFTPNYESRFDISDLANIKWEPHGEHNFRSWGVFHTEAGPARGEVVVEINTRAEALVAIDSTLVPLVQPFAKMSSDRITEAFLQKIKAEIEARQVVQTQG